MFRNALLSFLLTFLSSHLSAQDIYRDKLNDFIDEQRQEKIYLHLDKPQYAAGEDIWLKAYVINATTHLPTEVSSTLHIELIDQEKTIIDSLTLFIKDGVSSGSFSLKRNLIPGSYRVRAYTEWMKNYDHRFFYRKDLQIISSREAHQETTEDLSNEPKTIVVKDNLLIDFLPEGGDLIDGIPTKVAIKATDRLGNNLQIKGIIISDQKEEITRFQTNELGYALSFLNPKFGESYLALVADDTIQLPLVKDAGASIRVIHRHKSDDVLIAVLSNNIDLTGGTIVLHNKGRFLFSQKCPNEHEFAIRLKKSQLGSGIVHITLFNKNQVPLSERLIFPNPPSKDPKINISTDKSNYKKRSKVTLKLNAKSTDVHSASITVNPQRESSYDEHGENIENYLLLSSDLRGKISSPDVYFTDTKEAHKALDLLMLTHGWSRFDWVTLLSTDEFAPCYLPEEGLTINGKVSNFYTDKLLEDAYLGVTIPSMGILGETFRVSEEGTFQLAGLQLMDSTDIYMQVFRNKGAKLKNDKSAKIAFDYPPRQEETVDFFNVQNVKPAFEEKAKKLTQISNAYFLDSEAFQLHEVVVIGRPLRKVEMDKRGAFYSEPTSRLVLDNLITTPTAVTVIDLLRGIPGVIVSGSLDNPTVTIRGASTLGQGPNAQPLYFLDGLPVDNTLINRTPIDNVQFIDVLKGTEAAILGSRGLNGAIMVYTRRGESAISREESTGTLAFTHPGYHKAKEFYSPRYDAPEEEHIIPDYRTTIHWEPEVRFENKRAEMTFYTSDQTGFFTIRVEGMSNNGDPFFEESSIRIK